MNTLTVHYRLVELYMGIEYYKVMQDWRKYKCCGDWLVGSPKGETPLLVVERLSVRWKSASLTCMAKGNTQL